MSFLRYLHADLDAFFVSVEVLKNPALKGLPVIVGGLNKRGVVSTCSYAARKFGIHSAMPMYLALRKCPDAIVLPHDMSAYKAYSDKVFSILHAYSPEVEKVSVDEAYLDMTGTEKLYSSTEKLVQSIRQRVLKETGLVISIGASFNKTLAKIATGMAKPDNFFLLDQRRFNELKYSLPLNQIPGIGRKSDDILRRHGLVTGGDLLNHPVNEWAKFFGSQTRFMIDFFNGIDLKEVKTEYVRKSIAREHTFAEDADRETALATLSEFCREFSTHLTRNELKPRHVSLKVRTPSFKTMTRSKSFREEVWMERDLFDIVKALFALIPESLSSFRLVGISLSHFNLPEGTEMENQLDLWGDSQNSTDVTAPVNKREKAAKVMESLKMKIGQNAIQWGLYSDKPVSSQKKPRHKL